MPLDLNSNPDAQILYEVDGTSVFREGLDVIAALLLGDPGTEVHLHLRTKSMSVSKTCRSSIFSRWIHAPIYVLSFLLLSSLEKGDPKGYELNFPKFHCPGDRRDRGAFAGRAGHRGACPAMHYTTLHCPAPYYTALH